MKFCFGVRQKEQLKWPIISGYCTSVDRLSNKAAFPFCNANFSLGKRRFEAVFWSVPEDERASSLPILLIWMNEQNRMNEMEGMRKRWRKSRSFAYLPGLVGVTNSDSGGRSSNPRRKCLPGSSAVPRKVARLLQVRNEFRYSQKWGISVKE